MADSDDVVTRYAARLLALKAERDAVITDEDLQAIARDLGMSDADVDAVAGAVVAHRARGEGYLAHGRLDDAVAEFDAAAALAPRDIELLHALALALQRRDGDGDRHRARTLSRRVLALSPAHAPSFALLNALDKGKGKGRGLAAIALGLTATAVPFLVISALIASRDDVPPLKKRSDRKAESVAEPAAPPGDADDTDTGMIDLPLTIVDDAHSAGLRLEVRSSVLSRYPDSAFYEVRALVVSERDALIAELDWRLDLKDKSGVVVATAKHSAPASHEAALRKGDSTPFAHLLPASKSASTATLTLLRAEQEPATSWPAWARLRHRPFAPSRSSSVRTGARRPLHGSRRCFLRRWAQGGPCA